MTSKKPSSEEIEQFPESTKVRAKKTPMYMSYDDWWSMYRLGQIKCVLEHSTYTQVLMPTIVNIPVAVNV